MIVREEFKTRADGVKLFRTYSDQSMKIRKVGTDEIYDEAIDVEDAPWTYEEYVPPVESDDPEDIIPEVGEDTEAPIMTRAELTQKVAELDEALNLLLSGVTE